MTGDSIYEMGVDTLVLMSKMFNSEANCTMKIISYILRVSDSSVKCEASFHL